MLRIASFNGSGYFTCCMRLQARAAFLTALHVIA
jgi:hypothetical protein